nr:MAG TPA: hypothetical protein [Caudoviricetes sp.]
MEQKSLKTIAAPELVHLKEMLKEMEEASAEAGAADYYPKSFKGMYIGMSMAFGICLKMIELSAEVTVNRYKRVE